MDCGLANCRILVPEVPGRFIYRRMKLEYSVKKQLRMENMSWHIALMMKAIVLQQNVEYVPLNMEVI